MGNYGKEHAKGFGKTALSPFHYEGGDRLKAKEIAAALLLWLVFGVVAALVIGVYPRTWIGAVLIIGVGPIALLLGEALFAGVQRVPPVPSIARGVRERTKEKRFSPLRIAVALLGVLILFGVMWLAVAASEGTGVERWLRGLGEPLGQHVGW